MEARTAPTLMTSGLERTKKFQEFPRNFWFIRRKRARGLKKADMLI
jgi:hypothetical protein